MSITVEILDIEAGSSYNDTVFDQWIEVRLPTGESMRLFDDEMLLSEEAKTEKRANIRPMFNISEISVHSGSDYGIEVVDTDSGTDQIYRGQIENIQLTDGSENSTETIFELNVGFGTVRFSVGDTSDLQLSVDDEIELPAFRSDLVGVEDA